MAYSLITSTSAGSSDGTAVTTSGINTTGADLIVIARATANSAVTPTDSNSNTWTALTLSNDGIRFCRLFYCRAPIVGAGHTFSISSAGSSPTISVLALSGSVASPADQETGTTGTGTSQATGSITPGENNELIVAAICLPASNTNTPTIDSSMTRQTGTTGSAGLHMNGHIAYLIQTSAAAINPTWSWTTSGGNADRIASFKAAATGVVFYPAVRQLIAGGV